MTMRNSRLTMLLLLVLLLSVSAGCGQKGDLYLADKTDKKQDFASH